MPDELLVQEALMLAKLCENVTPSFVRHLVNVRHETRHVAQSVSLRLHRYGVRDDTLRVGVLMAACRTLC